MTIGEIIKKYRKMEGLTQTELAHRIGHKGPSGISKIESGVNEATFDLVVNIALALNVDPMIFMMEQRGDKFAGYREYLPYLAEASEETLRNIRFMLGMPPKKIYVSSKEIV